MTPEERSRAILWALCDWNPGMPLVEALGYLKAVEMRIEHLESVTAAEADGGFTVAALIKEYAGKPAVVAAAKRGEIAWLSREIRNKSGCPALIAHATAESLALLHGEA